MPFILSSMYTPYIYSFSNYKLSKNSIIFDWQLSHYEKSLNVQSILWFGLTLFHRASLVSLLKTIKCETGKFHCEIRLKWEDAMKYYTTLEKRDPMKNTYLKLHTTMRFENQKLIRVTVLSAIVTPPTCYLFFDRNAVITRHFPPSKFMPFCELTNKSEDNTGNFLAPSKYYTLPLRTI